MGNSSISTRLSSRLSGRAGSSIQAPQQILLIKADSNADYHVSKYQHHHDNKVLQCFETLRWKLNMALSFKPFSCLSHCNSYREWHQWLYELSISELLFWSAVLTMSTFPILWLIQTLHSNQPLLEYNTKTVIAWSNETYSFTNSPGNKYGIPCSICYVIVFILALRNTLWNTLFGLSFERMIKIHKICARLTLILTFVHFWEYRNFAWFKGQCLTGSIAFCCVILITLSSFNIIRRKLWQIFHYSHWFLFVIFLYFGIKHGAKYLYISIGFFLIDLIFRIYVIFNKPVCVKSIQLLPCNIIRIEFDKKKFKFDAGQFIFICIPAIALFEWHPFSISSAPHNADSIMIHIRVLGDWTKKLYKYLSHRQYECLHNNLLVFVEGPYGELQVPLHEYQSIIMISGGIGITPLQSIFNELIHQIATNSSPKYQDEERENFHDFVRRIHFVWSVRDILAVNEFGKRHWAGIQHKNDEKFNEFDNERLPSFYSPDLLLVQQGTKMVQKTKIMTQFYLTRVQNEERKKSYSQRYKLLKFGRPNIEKIIKKAKEEFIKFERESVEEVDDVDTMSEYATESGCCLDTKRGKGVCVLCCGPIGMIKEVKKYAAKYGVDCHFEVFEL